MLAQPVAGALDVDDHGVVKQPIEQRGGDDWIAENLPPLGKAAVGGQDHGAALVARVDQLEEQIAGTGTDTQIALDPLFAAQASIISSDERQRKRIRSRRRPSRSARATLSMISASGEK